MIKYFIRTTLERELDESVIRELGEDYTLLVDTEHRPIESFIEQLSIISEYDAVLLEDDVILCKNFKQRIEEVIDSNRDKIINFWTDPYEYFKTRISVGIRCNVGTYYPKGVGKILSEKMLNHINDSKQYDTIESYALMELKINVINYRPCLIQHMDNKSLIGNDNKFPYKILRCTPYFVDYLEELNISYEEAWTKENRNKLFDLMEDKFKSKEV